MGHLAASRWGSLRNQDGDYSMHKPLDVTNKKGHLARIYSMAVNQKPMSTLVVMSDQLVSGCLFNPQMVF